MLKSPYPFHVGKHFRDTLMGFNRPFLGSVDLDLNQSTFTSTNFTSIVLRGRGFEMGNTPPRLSRTYAIVSANGTVGCLHYIKTSQRKDPQHGALRPVVERSAQVVIRHKAEAPTGLVGASAELNPQPA